MIAFKRSVTYQDNREPVDILVELHYSAAQFLAVGAPGSDVRPIASFPLKTEQQTLTAHAVVNGRSVWDDPDVLAVGQVLLDAHPQHGGQGYVLTKAPDLPVGP